MQPEHASEHLCVTPLSQLLLQPAHMYCLVIAPVRFAMAVEMTCYVIVQQIDSLFRCHLPFEDHILTTYSPVHDNLVLCKVVLESLKFRNPPPLSKVIPVSCNKC